MDIQSAAAQRIRNPYDILRNPMVLGSGLNTSPGMLGEFSAPVMRPGYDMNNPLGLQTLPDRNPMFQAPVSRPGYDLGTAMGNPENGALGRRPYDMQNPLGLQTMPDRNPVYGSNGGFNMKPPKFNLQSAAKKRMRQQNAG